MTAATVRARASYASLALYAPDRRPCAIDLSDNTNLWGMPPAAEHAMRDAAVASVTRYPEVYAQPLKRALATYAGVDPSMIVTGCGSDDVLDSAIRALGEPGDLVAMPDPSFAMIPAFARMNALEPLLVPLTRDYDVDVDAMLMADAAIVYLCSPNNPTGTPLARESIERIAAHTHGILIVDEAYAEFAAESILDLAMHSDRVLVVRTMSKAFGLAGLRIGYAIGHPALVAQVEKSRGPYKINGIAECAALAALGAGFPWVRARVDAVIELRSAFVDALRAMGLDPLPSRANFVLVPIAGAPGVAEALRVRGVAVRPFESLNAPPGTPLAATGGSALRITIGPQPMLDAALGAMREVLR
ncbi:MAG: pyridoxal phosphate-dependent aminotransferase [Gemmatimonadaceae bacterium]